VSCALVALVVGISRSSVRPALAGTGRDRSIDPRIDRRAASVIGSAATYYSVLTVNAFNGWALVGSNPLAGAISSQNSRGRRTRSGPGADQRSVTRRRLLVLTTMLVVATLWIRDDPMSILLAFCVPAIAFFVLPTRVHERYLFPVFGVGALVAAMSPRWLAWYIALAVTNVANLHAVLTCRSRATGRRASGPAAWSFLRDPFVVGIIADLHMLLFVGVIAAFLWQVSLPAFRSLGLHEGGRANRRRRPSLDSFSPTIQDPSRSCRPRTPAPGRRSPERSRLDRRTSASSSA
jgi:hypothetical protein